MNGPEGPRPVFDGDAWEQVDWREHEQRVRRLRCRIFKAVQVGDLATVRNLQRLMLRSWSNTLSQPIRTPPSSVAGESEPGSR